MSWKLGEKRRLKVTFEVSDLVTNPTVVVLILRYPDGTQKSILSSTGFSLLGNWDANENSPALVNGTGNAGEYYSVTTAGISLGQAFAVGDYVVYDGDEWLLVSSPVSGENLISSGTGVFYYDLPVHQEGRYRWRFEGFGTVHAAGESSETAISTIFR